MKKILLSTGLAISALAPITTVIACGDPSKKAHHKMNTEETAYTEEQMSKKTLAIVKEEIASYGKSIGIIYYVKNISSEAKEYTFNSSDSDDVLSDTLTQAIEFSSTTGEVPASLLNSNKWVGWKMTAGDVIWHTINTAKEGIIDNLDVHTSTRDTALSTTPTTTFYITKEEIINSGGPDKEYSFDALATKIKTYLSDNQDKKFGIYVIENIEDVMDSESGEYSSGEWEVQLFEKIQSDAKMDAAIKSLKEDFSFNKTNIKEVHGTYLYGMEDHSFNPLITSSGKGIAEATTNEDFDTWSFLNPTVGKLKDGSPDRREGDTLATWTNYIIDSDKFNEATEKERIFKIFDDADNNHGIILRQVQFVRDFKTGVQNLRIVVERTDANAPDPYAGVNYGTLRNSETIYIPAPEMTQWYDGTINEDEFKEIIKNRINFLTMFDFMQLVKDEMSIADSMYNIKDLMMNVFSASPQFASASHFMAYDDFLDKFIEYMNSKYSESEMNYIYSGAIDYEYLHSNNLFNSEGIPFYGGYAYNGLSNLELIIKNLSAYIDLVVEDGTYSYQDHKDYWLLRNQLYYKIDDRDLNFLEENDITIPSNVTMENWFQYVVDEVMGKEIYMPSDEFLEKIKEFKSEYDSANTEIRQVTITNSNGSESTIESFSEQTKLLIEFLGENFDEFKDDTIATEAELVSKLSTKIGDVESFAKLGDVNIRWNEKYHNPAVYAENGWTVITPESLKEDVNTSEKVFEIFFEEFDKSYLMGESKFESFSYKIYYGLLKPLGITFGKWK